MYAFYMYENDQKDILPTEIFETEYIKVIDNLLKDDPVVAMGCTEDRQVWFYAHKKEYLRAFLSGMSFVLNDMMTKDWTEILTPKHPELIIGENDV